MGARYGHQLENSLSSQRDFAFNWQRTYLYLYDLCREVEDCFDQSASRKGCLEEQVSSHQQWGWRMKKRSPTRKGRCKRIYFPLVFSQILLRIWPWTSLCSRRLRWKNKLISSTWGYYGNLLRTLFRFYLALFRTFESVLKLCNSLWLMKWVSFAHCYFPFDVCNYLLSSLKLLKFAFSLHSCICHHTCIFFLK